MVSSKGALGSGDGEAGGEASGISGGQQIGSIAGGLGGTKAGEAMVEIRVNPRSKPGNSGDKTQSIRKSLSVGEIPGGTESPLGVNMTDGSGGDGGSER